MNDKKTETRKQGPNEDRRAFFCLHLMRSFLKSFKRTSIAQAHFEYIIILLVVASVTLLSVASFFGKFNKETYEPEGGICQIAENAFRTAVNRILAPPEE